MIRTAIISEYNPFHNGHKYQIEKARQATSCDTIIAIMSGNYVQRGEPAVLDKYTRADMALHGGVDICLQIPTAIVLSSAQHYAFGSVSILDRLKICDYLCFGSECGNIEILCDIAKILYKEPAKYKEMLKENLKCGMTYAASVSKALCDYSNEPLFEKIISHPNNVLGIEYIKALLLLNSSIKPVTIKRTGANHDDILPDNQNNSASASFIRKNINSNLDLSEYMPGYSFERLCNYPVNSLMELNDIGLIFRYLVNVMTKRDLLSFYAINDSVAARILKFKNSSLCPCDYIEAVKTKDISYSRLSRSFLSIITKFTKDMADTISKQGFPFVRLLALNTKYSAVLSQCRENANITLISKWSSYKPDNVYSKKLLDYEIGCDNLYYELQSSKSNSKYENEIKKQSIIL